MASSSCSYAAVALARSLFRKGANFTAAMDMSVHREGSFARRLFSRDGFTATSHVFVMEWAAILRDLIVGLLVAGAVAAWVPDSFWRAFFFDGHPLAAKLWGPVVGPLVAIASFVCSIGNVPLAVVLWKGGISFGGVVAMVVAGYVVEIAFGGLGLVPARADARIPMEGVSWNYTTWLNIAFLLLAAVLLVRFMRTGGPSMLRMMGGSPDTGHDHAGHQQPGHRAGDRHGGHHH